MKIRIEIQYVNGKTQIIEDATLLDFDGEMFEQELHKPTFFDRNHCIGYLDDQGEATCLHLADIKSFRVTAVDEPTKEEQTPGESCFA